MWPFKKQPPPTAPPSSPPPPTPYFGTTTLQVGDECVCINDEEHRNTHQKLLVRGQVYKVRDVHIVDAKHGMARDGYSGPWIRVEGITPINDASWFCRRFQKVTRQASSIIAKVSEPAPGLDVEKEKVDAY